MASKFDNLVTQARKLRADSLAKVSPPLPALPDPLPLNVTKLPEQILTAREVEITSYASPELIELMSSKKVSCEEVTRAFLRRAALAQAVTNCLTELLWDEALERAKYLDSLPAPAGPCHGLPVSVKEQCGFEGKPNSGSYVAWTERATPIKPDANEVLWNAGCVFIARTTQPQTVMHLESNTPTYGVTVNPYNRNLTSGGSSGGEGALIGFRGSVFGLGGDIGGSIRNPAGNNGIYGFKPTPQRVSTAGSVAAISGQEGISSARGPMTSCRRGLSLFMKTYLDSEPWLRKDSIPPIPWREINFKSPIRLGVMWDDGVVRPHPPVTRALREVVEKCTAAGMEIVEWEPYRLDHADAWKITSALYFEDGGKRHKELLAEGGEEMLPLSKWIIDENPNVKYQTTEEVWALKARRDAYRAAHKDAWMSTADASGHPIDALLCPYLPSAAPPLGTSKYWSYTSQWNLLDYPAAVFPVTVVDQELDKKESYEPRNEEDERNWKLWERGAETFKDAPVSLQVVGVKWEDEKVLKVLEEVERAMGRD